MPSVTTSFGCPGRIRARSPREIAPTGYAREALALRLLGAEAEGVTFDCEADMFAARCPTAAPLEALAAALTRLLEDPSALAAAIEAAGGELD